MTRSLIVRTVVSAILALALLTLALGLGFHIGWKHALATCRETRAARGEFVDPEVFGGPLGLVFDVIYWPVYAAANAHHFGTPFATPCSR